MVISWMLIRHIAGTEAVVTKRLAGLLGCRTVRVQKYHYPDGASAYRNAS